MRTVLVSGSFDDLRSRHIRLLEEAARRGSVHACLWSDEAIRAATGAPPRFPEAERRYLVEAIRFVAGSSGSGPRVEPEGILEGLPCRPDAWVVEPRDATARLRAACEASGILVEVISPAELLGFPSPEPTPCAPGTKKVLVTGCYDWFHSGHVRFFEEVSALGALHVVVGHDANVRLLKGDGHPMFGDQERRYVVGSIRHVHQALVSTGWGWLDAEPEIVRIRPDIYAVNEDGDKPEKRRYCEEHGIEYAVLRRTPREGLPRRQSTDLRGF